jgi:acylglycerol lipase
MARWLPRVPVLKLPNKDFSRDVRIVANRNADSLIAGEIEPAATVAALIAANRRLDRDFGKIALPLLILHGNADKLAKVGGSRRFQQAAGSSDKTLKIYAGQIPDLLADLGKEQVIADVIDWLQARLAAQR